MFDFDVDGDLDLVVQNWQRESALLVHQGFSPPPNAPEAARGAFRSDEPGSREEPRGAHWLELRLVGTRSNRNAIGAKLRIVHGDRRQTREISCGSGYMSTSSLVVHFGLGDSERIDSLEVRWPSGVVQRFENLLADRKLVVTEGSEMVSTAPVPSSAERAGGRLAKH